MPATNQPEAMPVVKRYTATPVNDALILQLVDEDDHRHELLLPAECVRQLADEFRQTIPKMSRLAELRAATDDRSTPSEPIA